MLQEEKNFYGLPFCQLENLNDIKIGKYHYNYKTVDFMFNYKENTEKMIILFHASIKPNCKLPMFLKQDYENDNVNVLSISDKLLEYNTKNRNTNFMRCTGFMESTDYPLHDIYIEIMKKCIEKSQCKKNIFVGPCIGAKPAVYFGSLLNGIIVILNGYLYQSKENIAAFEKNAGFKEGSSILYNIEDMIVNSQPQFINMYINKQDLLTMDMNIKFINFCKRVIPNKFEVIKFDYMTDKGAHHSFFPEGETFESIIDKM